MTSRGPTLAFFFAFVFFTGALVYWVLQQPGVRRAPQGEKAPNPPASGALEPRSGTPASSTARLGKQIEAGSETGAPVEGESSRSEPRRTTNDTATADGRATTGAASAIRGEPIRPLTRATGAVQQSSSVAATGAAVRVEPAQPRIQPAARSIPADGANLGWDVLSGFKFDVYEVASETSAGRPLVTTDDPIPDDVKAWNGRRVTVEGFILPLRTRQRQVTEFLLLRDQGTCCFGPKAQINHFIRVKYFQGFRPNAPVPYRATGVLRVGEIRVQGYLTGIYEMDASHVEAGEED